MSDLFNSPSRVPMVRTICLWQPWASLWLSGVKVHETRGWRIPYQPPLGGEWIGLHAAAAPIRAVGAFVTEELHALCVNSFGTDYRKTLPRGHVIGKVFVDAVYPAHLVTWNVNDQRCGNFSQGRQAWHRAGAEPCAPFAWRGQQKWFGVPADMFKPVSA